MQSKFVSFSIMFVCILLASCSKKPDAAVNAEPSPAAAPQSTTAATAPASGPAGSSVVAATLPEVTKAVQNGQYESAVQTLTQLKPAQMNDAQRLQYQQALRDTTSALLIRQDDPAAKAAYQKLSRAATGR